MRTIILSYDYEIFFGDKSGTIEKTLIVPTNFLLNKMDELEIKGNIFYRLSYAQIFKKS